MRLITLTPLVLSISPGLSRILAHSFGVTGLLILLVLLILLFFGAGVCAAHLGAPFHLVRCSESKSIANHLQFARPELPPETSVASSSKGHSHIDVLACHLQATVQLFM